MATYKRGALVNVCSPGSAGWESSFRAIEKLSFRNHVELWMEHMPSREERTILKTMLRGTEVIIHGPFIHMSLVTHLDAIREVSLQRCEQTLEFADDIGAKVVTLHAGSYPVFETHETALERLAKVFDKFTAFQSPVVTLENMPVKGGTTRECIGKLSDLRTIKSILPDTRFTLDIGHAIQNGDDYESFLKTHCLWVEAIHLHDGKLGGRSHLPIGAGSLDLRKLIDLLSALRFSKYITLETISEEDTLSSWRAWIDAEQAVGVKP